MYVCVCEESEATISPSARQTQKLFYDADENSEERGKNKTNFILKPGHLHDITPRPRLLCTMVNDPQQKFEF